MVYTSDARKAQYLTYREYGMKSTEAAKRAGIPRSIAHDIWMHAGNLEVQHNENDLLPPTIEELVAIKPKTGRPPILSSKDCNDIFAACTKDKKNRQKQQHHIALE